jgi:hypothetical protein
MRCADLDVSVQQLPGVHVFERPKELVHDVLLVYLLKDARANHGVQVRLRPTQAPDKMTSNLHAPAWLPGDKGLRAGHQGRLYWEERGSHLHILKD